MLVNEQVVIGAKRQIVGVIQRARLNYNRGEIPDRAHCVLADPADYLTAIIARLDFVTDLKLFNRTSRAGTHGDVGAARERYAGDLRQFTGRIVHINADQTIVTICNQWDEGDDMNVLNKILGVLFNKQQYFQGGTVAAHHSEATIHEDTCERCAYFSIFHDCVGAVEFDEQGQAAAFGEIVKFVDIIKHHFGGKAQYVIDISTVNNEKLFCARALPELLLAFIRNTRLTKRCAVVFS